jgi:hypothetical protein
LILFTDQDLIEFTQTVYYILFFRGDWMICWKPENHFLFHLLNSLTKTESVHRVITFILYAHMGTSKLFRTRSRLESSQIISVGSTKKMDNFSSLVWTWTGLILLDSYVKIISK